MSEQSDVERARDVLLEAFKAGQIRVYRNLFDQPQVICDHPAHPPLDRHLFDPGFSEWCTSFVWTERNLFLGESEMKLIRNLLAGLSFRNRVPAASNRELLEILQKEPVAAAVVEFMEAKKTPHESTMKELWNELRRFIDETGRGGSGRHRFPAGPHVLSRKLRELEKLLAHFGIAIEIRRSNGSKVVLSRRLDASAPQASAQPSAENSLPVDDLDAEDDREQRLAALEDRRRTTTNLQKGT